MAGQFALDAKIFTRADQSAPEEMLPEAVDGDASDQWILRVEQPIGEADAVAWMALAEFAKTGGRFRSQLFGFVGLIVLAAAEQVGGARFVQFVHHHHGPILAWLGARNRGLL